MSTRWALLLTAILAAACSGEELSGGSGGAAGSGGTGGASGAAGGSGGTAGNGGNAGNAGAGGVGGTTPGGSGGGSSGAAGAAGGNDCPAPHPSAAKLGCSDGTREGFADYSTYTQIAACSGGWDVMGLVGPDTKVPKCCRQGGNDGSQSAGEGCSVEDLCAEGWHVCLTTAELGKLGPTCASDTTAPPSPSIWISRQAMTGGATEQCDPTGMNNVLGCGNIGQAPPSNCAPYNRVLWHDACLATPPWVCGDASSPHTEAAQVIKQGAEAGGVLCCKNQ